MMSSGLERVLPQIFLSSLKPVLREHGRAVLIDGSTEGLQRWARLPGEESRRVKNGGETRERERLAPTDIIRTGVVSMIHTEMSGKRDSKVHPPCEREDTTTATSNDDDDGGDGGDKKNTKRQVLCRAGVAEER